MTKSISGTVSYVDTYVYAQDGSPLELLRTQNGVTNRYWYLLDGRGSVVGLVDGNATVVDQYVYDLWGAPTTVSEQVPRQLRSRGYWYDNETGWYWLQIRAYDPVLKRFVEPDPSGQDGQFSYAYAGDNPVDASDPSGFAACGECSTGYSCLPTDSGVETFVQYGTQWLWVATDNNPFDPSRVAAPQTGTYVVRVANDQQPVYAGITVRAPTPTRSLQIGVSSQALQSAVAKGFEGYQFEGASVDGKAPPSVATPDVNGIGHGLVQNKTVVVCNGALCGESTYTQSAWGPWYLTAPETKDNSMVTTVPVIMPQQVMQLTLGDPNVYSPNSTRVYGVCDAEHALHWGKPADVAIGGVGVVVAAAGWLSGNFWLGALGTSLSAEGFTNNVCEP